MLTHWSYCSYALSHRYSVVCLWYFWYRCCNKKMPINQSTHSAINIRSICLSINAAQRKHSVPNQYNSYVLTNFSKGHSVSNNFWGHHGSRRFNSHEIFITRLRHHSSFWAPCLCSVSSEKNADVADTFISLINWEQTKLRKSHWWLCIIVGSQSLAYTVGTVTSRIHILWLH